MPNNRKPMILCAGKQGRAIIYGYVDEYPEPGEPIKIHQAQMVLRWEGGGLFRVAAEGPIKEDRITKPVPSTLETVWQEWIEVTDEAERAWSEYEHTE